MPKSTPDYMLYVETGLAPIYLHTLKLHADYICKIMQYDDERIPKKMAKIILQKRSLFVKEWLTLSEKNNVALNINIDNIDTWKEKLYTLLEKTDSNLREQFLIKARSSNHRHIYVNLNHNLGPNNYFNEKYSITAISNIFKARGELLSLNFRPHIETPTTICDLCNLNKTEDSIHFVGECPILKEIRMVHLKKESLTKEETMEYLNGEEWLTLSNYIEEALSYRRIIRNEYY